MSVTDKFSKHITLIPG